MHNVVTMAISGEEIGAMTICGSLAIALIAIVGGYVSRIIRVRAYEASRREIAAYVAEGSISATDAAKLLAAQPEQVQASACLT